MTENTTTLEHNNGTSADPYWPFTGAADVCHGEHGGSDAYLECCLRAGLAYVLEQREERLAKMLSHSTEFTFRPDFGDLNDQFSDDPEQRDAITVTYRGPSEKGGNPDRWAILHGGAWCWSKVEGCWVYEVRPSSRGEDFFAACRFSRDEAVALVPSLLRGIEALRIPELQRMVEARGGQRP